MKLKNILITGGAGFIGSNLALKLEGSGYNVTVLDNLTTQIHGNKPFLSPLYISIKDKVNFIYGDVTIREDWEKAIREQDAVIHLAAETGTGQSMYAIEAYTKTNVIGTALLWDVISNKNFPIRRVIMASSRAIYGEGKYLCQKHGIVYPLPREDENMKKGDFNVKCPVCGGNTHVIATTEDSLIHPTSIYGFTKHAQEELCLIAGKAMNIPVVALRYQNVFGPGQSLSNPYTGILSIFSTRIKNGNEINVFEDGYESRDFVYIDDVIDATILAMTSDNANYQAINVGTGVPTSVMKVAQTLKKLYQSSVLIKITGNYRIGDIRDNFADISKLKNHLGFIPSTSFSEGISKFVEWVNMQDIKEDMYETSIREMKEKGLYK